MAAVFALTRALNAHLKAIGWSGGGELSAVKFAGRLLPGSDFILLVERAMGQALYLTLASYGLFLVAVVVVIWWLVDAFRTRSFGRLLATPRTGVPSLR